MSLTINGILTHVYYEVPNIACAAFAEFVNFHSKPALCDGVHWIQPSRPFQRRRGSSTQMLRSGVYMEENLEFR